MSTEVHAFLQQQAVEQYFEWQDGKLTCTLNGHCMPCRLQAVSAFVQCDADLCNISARNKPIQEARIAV